MLEGFTDSDITTKGNPGNKTSTTNKTLQTREVEHHEEGGATVLDQADRITPLSADIVVSLATTR